jgi:hypothetical protein
VQALQPDAPHAPGLGQHEQVHPPDPMLDTPTTPGSYEEG